MGATAQYYSLSNANSRLSNADSSADRRTLNASRPYGVIKAPSFNIATQSFRYSRKGFHPVTSGFPIFQFFGNQFFFSLYCASSQGGNQRNTVPLPRVRNRPKTWTNRSIELDKLSKHSCQPPR